LPPLALLAGSAVNQDGRSSGLTAPNGPAQQEVLRAALVAAGLAPGDVSGISMHGTGTGLGDPIEVGALAAVFSSSASSSGSCKEAQLPGGAPPARQPLTLLSSKSALGHAEPAAGVVGLLHAQLALQQRAALPIVHLRALNPLVSEAAAGGAARRGWCLPRDGCGQGLPGAAGGAEAGVIATSAFAYQVGRPTGRAGPKFRRLAGCATGDLPSA
jgi:3-oxoacyl-(acyl-carrier-protein) synthase